MVINLVSCSILLLAFSLGHALERRNLGMKPKGTIKTIKSIENGDVIDCVDYYQQPAFDNPMINNSQVHPSYIPRGLKMRNNTHKELTQTWHKYGSCPEGTVPIRRSLNNRIFTKYSNDRRQGIHEYATAYQTGTFYGGAANINLWNPHTEVEDEISSSQIWILSASGTPNCNTVEAGWMVSPEKYGDALTRLFVFFTNDNYQHTTCYNNDCHNFVQVPGSYSLGCSFEGSAYDGPQFDIEFSIHKDEDKQTGHWWVAINGIPLGYWPHNLFTTLSHSAEKVSWGGKIVNKKTSGIHTYTHMGSGRLAYEGLGKASYFREVGVLDSNHNWVDASFSGLHVTNNLCYDLNVQPQGSNYGTFFLYGGPGLSESCYNPPDPLSDP